MPNRSQGTAMKITILVDDRALKGLEAEHGLSFWIEADGKHILFDAGQGSAFESNARILGVDFRKTDILVLSHGHYDHTGGIPRILQEAPNVHVYCHPEIGRARYTIRNAIPKPIQMPLESQAALDLLPRGHLHWVRHRLALSDKINLTGPIPRETSFEDTGGPFFLDPRGTRADPIEDDLALWIHTDEGAIVCVGCSHSGLVNTLSHVRRLSDGAGVRAVIGGFHLLQAGRERLGQTMAALRSLDPDMVVPCHCTGHDAVQALQEALGERVTLGAAGMTLEF
jgi:7,8-dihydropterin-6-yl-methyl-4-(beta-D-ribofuranosyl)aminobenzene 5'-phosphate synthase